MNDLAREAQIFNERVDEWRRDHLGEYVVIKGDEIIGFYRTLDEAFGTGTERFGLEPFSVNHIVPKGTVNVSLFGRRIRAA